MIRVFDVILSFLALVLLSPLLVLTALILKITGEREVFYKQSRVGKCKKPFYLLKFATMKKDSPNIGSGTITIHNDPRILPFGKILRKTKVNELPQLINVLLGDMSLIGPRPLTFETYSAYNQSVQDIIAECRPGLSGVGSIVFRDEDKLMKNSDDSRAIYFELIAPYKGELEVWFTNKRSNINYFLFILLTVHVVIFPKSKLLWKLFNDIPEPKKELKQMLNF